MLRLALEKERGVHSEYADYIGSLPQEAPNTPLHWRGNDDSLLKATPAETGVERLKSDLWRVKSHADNLATCCDSTPRPSDRTIEWAHAMALSRSVSLGEGRDAALVPLLDLADHDVERGGSWRIDEEEGMISLVHPHGLEPGEEVTLDYGEKGNCELLISYGFCLHPNPRETCQLAINWQPTTGADEPRWRLFHAWHLRSRHELKWHAIDIQPALENLRLQVAPAREAQLKAERDLLPEICHGMPGCDLSGSFSCRTELRACSALGTSLACSLQALSASESEDSAVLPFAHTDGTSNVRSVCTERECIAAVRHGQRALIRAALRRLACKTTDIATRMTAKGNELPFWHAFERESVQRHLQRSGVALHKVAVWGWRWGNEGEQDEGNGSWTQGSLKLVEGVEEGDVLAEIPPSCVIWSTSGGTRKKEEQVEWDGSRQDLAVAIANASEACRSLLAPLATEARSPLAAIGAPEGTPLGDELAREEGQAERVWQEAHMADWSDACWARQAAVTFGRRVVAGNGELLAAAPVLSIIDEEMMGSMVRAIASEEWAIQLVAGVPLPKGAWLALGKSGLTGSELLLAKGRLDVEEGADEVLEVTFEAQGEGEIKSLREMAMWAAGLDEGTHVGRTAKGRLARVEYASSFARVAADGEGVGSEVQRVARARARGNIEEYQVARKRLLGVCAPPGSGMPGREEVAERLRERGEKIKAGESRGGGWGEAAKRVKEGQAEAAERAAAMVENQDESMRRIAEISD